MPVSLSQGAAALSADPAYVQMMREDWMPWLLDGVDLGTDVLNLIVGPGLTAPFLLAPRRTLTLAEADPAFTAEVATRVADTPQIRVVQADPWRLPFGDGRFSAVAAVLMLHSIPSAAQQDQTLREIARVLRPGGRLVGLNALDGPHLRRMDTAGTVLPIEPLGFPDRLRANGFVDVQETIWTFVRFAGRTPGGDR